jgi:hypothetical protein
MMHLMPTKNPRLTVTLSAASSEQLAELSRLTNQSQSAIIADILEQSRPVFARLIHVLAAAEGAKAEMSSRMAQDFEKAQTKIEQQLGLVMDDFNDYTGSLLADVDAISRRSRRRPPGDAHASPSGRLRAPSTPLSNRGVRSDPKQAKKPTKTIACDASDLAKEKQQKHVKKGVSNGQV